MRVVLSLYMCVTCAMTIAHFVAEYTRTQHVLLNELNIIADSMHDSVANSLWQMNNAQLLALVDGLVIVPIIEGVDIFSPDGEKIISSNKYNRDESPFELFFIEKGIVWNINGNDLNLGIMRLYSSSDVIFSRVVFGFIFIAVNAIVKFSVLWFLFLWAFKKFLGEPLNRLAAQIDAIKLEDIGQRRIQLGISDPNELNRLQDHINEMLAKIERDRHRMIKVEKDRQAWLEAEVEKRTAELVRLNKELEHIALTDALTGIHSRRSFFEQSQALMELAMRSSQPLCVIALDLDHFKAINDTYGHATGDQVLCHFTKLVAGEVRKSDIFGRIGGEEFAITLPHTDVIGAQKLAEKICDLISKSRVSVGDKEILYTASLGIAQRGIHDTEISHILIRSDNLLYQAKEKGRNRVEIEIA
jgi:diguanylate cyclase (GGDEF)-like protein